MKWQVLLCGAPLAFAGCGPNLHDIVRDKQYREAVCAADEGRVAARELVGKALDQDADAHVHVHVVSNDELRPVLGEKTEAAAKQGKLVRVLAQTNILPLDGLHLYAEIKTEDGRTAGLPADWLSLAWITKEQLPPKRTASTYLTGANLLRGGAALLTAGISLFFTEFKPETYEVAAPLSEYQRVAPQTAALHQIAGTNGCHDLRLTEGAGRSCTWFFVIDNMSSLPVSLELVTEYVSRRQTGKRSTEETNCSLSRPVRIRLGSPETIETVARERFGEQLRPLRALVTAP